MLAVIAQENSPPSNSRSSLPTLFFKQFFYARVETASCRSSLNKRIKKRGLKKKRKEKEKKLDKKASSRMVGGRKSAAAVDSPSLYYF